MRAESVPNLEINGVIADFAAEVMRRRDGTSVALRPQAFAVLRHLAANPDRLVTKDELMAAVWPGLSVTDDSLVQCIHDIRRAIGDGKQAVLRTVPRRGYRLVLPASAEAPGSTPARGWTLAAGVGLAAVGGAAWWLAQSPEPTKVPMVAVLPFDEVTADETTRLLAKGLTMDVITDLGRIPEFEVLASGATAGYRGADTDPRAVGSALKAAYVVEGSIAREGDRVRVTAQLVDAGTGGSLWSERWDRPTADVFAVQTEIAETIANRLGGGAGLVQEAGRNAARRKPPASLDAYELYLLGSEKLEQINQADIEEAVTLLRKAVELDPGLARAWIEISHSHGALANFGVAPERNRQLADEAAERALLLDPSDAEAHAIVGMRFGERDDLARAEAELDTALRLAPNAAEILTFYIGWSSAFGEAQRGAGMIERAIRLEPSFPIWKARPYAGAYFMAGRYAEALEMIGRLTPENYNTMIWAMRPAALAALGRTSEAAAWVEQAIAARPDLTIEKMVNEPGYSDAERRRFIETMRVAGFPACAAPEALASLDAPRRLPECEAISDARATAPGLSE